jgi:hypothetical protein
MRPVDGVTVSAEMVALGVEAGATGPGSGATPGNEGEVKTIGVVAVATGATTFFTTGALALCLCTVAEPAVLPMTTVEQSNAALAMPTVTNLVLRDAKILFISFPSIDGFFILIFDIKPTGSLQSTSSK